MKYYISLRTTFACLTAFGLLATSYSQTATRNYIISYTPKIPLTDEMTVSTQTKENCIKTVQYFDGLGRPDQTIHVALSPLGNDIIQPIEYDQYGREVKKYLPYCGSNSNGNYVTTDFTEQSAYYAAQFPTSPDKDYPFAVTVFENSPLNHVLMQGAPGYNWQPIVPVDQHPVRYAYITNTTDDVRLWTVNSNNSITTSGFYLPGELYKTVIKDENWTTSSGYLNTTEEYKDLQGNVVLKRSYVIVNATVTPVEIYYVYDDLGLLRYVLPPEAIKNKGTETTLDPSSPLVKDLCYYYQYDSRERMIIKKLPGVEPVYMVYDSRDRLVATQDGNLRKDKNNIELKQWLFTKYDKLNRPVLTGILKTGSVLSQVDMQQLIDNAYAEPSPRAYSVERNVSDFGYTETSFPIASDGTEYKYLTATYYDNYSNIDTLGFKTSVNISGYTNGGLPYFDKIKGLITGTKVLVLDNNSTYLRSTIYYDDHYRPIQVARDIFDGVLNKTSYEVTSNKYDFVGNVVITKTQQLFNPSTGVRKTTVTKSHYYDHMNRLIKTDQQIDNNTPITIESLVYDDLGKLKVKHLHQTGTVGPLQSIDYEYNIRGWLTRINNPEATGNDKFAMELLYNNPTSINPLVTASQFNGNISGVIWKSDTQPTKGYGFVYDALNRLTGADYGEKNSTFNSAPNRYNEDLTYDLNGNIKSLFRQGYISPNDYSNYDLLDYNYGVWGNKLQKVVENGMDNLGFKDNDPSTIDYSYDLNGNLVMDLNKGITSIEYNYLNLPRQVTKDQNNKVVYTYDATGAKLRMTATINGGTTHRYYAGGFEYDGVILHLIHSDEGVTNVTESAGMRNYVPEYHLKDHLGNIRVAFIPSGTSVSVTQINDYYAFGKISWSSGSSGNKYLYNGKELQDELDLDWYDYGARFYDPQIGRWHVNDPLAELYTNVTPYCYVSNNPIVMVDQTGMSPDNYGVDKTGKTELIEKTSDNYDVLYIAKSDENGEAIKDSEGKMIPTDQNSDGNITEADGKKIKDKSLLPALSKSKGEYGGKVLTYAKGFDSYEMTGLYLFLANNTDVEWTIAGYSSENGLSHFTLSTIHSDRKATNADMTRDKIQDQYFDIHSHPLFNHIFGASEADMGSYYKISKETRQNDFGKAMFFTGVYEKENKTLYQYTETTSSLKRVIGDNPGRFQFGSFLIKK
jgi:RHS repeat-associated protein